MAETKDIEFIYHIYSPYILSTAITFETEIPGVNHFTDKMKVLMEEFPLLVYENSEGLVKGYAYINRHRERKAYQWCVESSVYISEEYFGKGVGEWLYQSLIDLSKILGYRRIYAGITLPNERSERFHNKFNFQQFAIFQKAGYKLGKWWDVAWYELVLADGTEEPTIPITSNFKALDF